MEHQCQHCGSTKNLILSPAAHYGYTHSPEEGITCFACENRKDDERRAEHRRLEGSIPYGLCWQIPLATLRSLRTPEEGRVFYGQWRGSSTASYVPPVADVLAIMRQRGCNQDEAVRMLLAERQEGD